MKITFIPKLFLAIIFFAVPNLALKAQTEDAPAFLQVKLPADAKLEVEGTLTKKTGPDRKFITPPLTPGKKYVYNLKITYTKDGKTITEDKVITVEAKKEIVVDFNEKPKDLKKDPKKEEPKKDAVKPTEPKKEEKKDPVKPTEPKKDEPKKDPVKPTEPKKDEPKKDPVKPTEPKKVEPSKKSFETIKVPYVPTPDEVVREMLKMATIKEGDVVYDLGCGDGRIVIAAVKDFKAKRAMGVDLDPRRIKESKENAVKAGVEKKVEFKQGDVLDLTDFSEVNVVTLYMLPEVNRKLMPILKKTLKPGSRVVSHDFDMGDWKADKEFKMMDVDGNNHMIYLWIIPEAKK